MIPWFWFLQVDYFSEGAESLLRIHNIILVLWVVSPKVQSDASMIIETTLRTVEMAVESCRSQGVSFPKELLLWEPWLGFVAFQFGAPRVLIRMKKTCPQNYWNPGNYIHDVFLLISEKSSQADNCVRESKNQWTLKLFSYLLATGHCRLAALLFSRVGHTHGVLGALIPCGNAFLLRQIIFSWEGFKFDVDYLEWLVSWVGPRFSRFHPGISLLLSPKPRGNSCLKHLLHIQDQLFGLVATAMRYIDILCDEADVVERLDIPVDWNHFVAKPFFAEGVFC